MNRRDFINGVLVTGAGVALEGCTRHSPLAILSKLGSPHTDSHLDSHIDSRTRSASDINQDPRAMRGGNLPVAFSIGHWMRDQRLIFQSNTVQLQPSSQDTQSGTFPIDEDHTEPDVTIVGSGISGLSAAFFLSRQNPRLRILLLDANPVFGGNTGRDDQSPLPVPSSTGAAYAVAPYADFLTEFYREIGVNWQSHLVADPFYSYFFDDRAPYALAGTRKWALDVYGKGLKGLPYPTQVLRDLEAARADFLKWNDCPGGPTDPPDNSDPKYDSLVTTSFHDYLVHHKKFHPALSDFYTRYSIDALGGTTAQVSAHSAISFLGSEYREHSLFAFPGGNSGISRYLLRWLIPGVIQGTTDQEVIHNPIQTELLDRPSQRVRIRQGSIAVQANTAPTGAQLTYFHEGKFYRVSSKSLIIATQAHSAQHLTQHLFSETRRHAWKGTTLVPVVVANVTLKSAAPLVDLGVGYNQYWWGSKYWADFVTADWVDPKRRMDRNRQTVLTFYGGNSAPPEAMPAERMKLMTTPFSDYENSLREDMSRIFGGTGFDFDRDVSAVYIYRWGHGMVFPKPGFSARGKSRLIARAPLGRISFAGQDTEGTPSLESAIASGLRCAKEVSHLCHL